MADIFLYPVISVPPSGTGLPKGLMCGEVMMLLPSEVEQAQNGPGTHGNDHFEASALGMAFTR